MPHDPSPLHSHISSKTKPELHLRPDLQPGSSKWYFRDDAGQVVALDSTHTLISEFGENGPPSNAVALEVFNHTDAAVTIECRGLDDAVVSPTGMRTIAPKGSQTWQCTHRGGTTCDCRDMLECKCGSWSVSSPSGAIVVPDPTFKVRWLAHTNPAPQS